MTATPYEYMHQKLHSQGLLFSEVPSGVQKSWKRWVLLDAETWSAERLWWSGIQCEYPTICAKCQGDLESFKTAFYEGGEKALLQRWKSECNKSCFWYAYFQGQRQKVLGTKEAKTKKSLEDIEARSYLRKRGSIK